MPRSRVSTVAVLLLWVLCGSAVEGHVHSRNGERHGGLASLFKPTRTTAALHHCVGRKGHFHPDIKHERTECFLCVDSRANGVPVSGVVVQLCPVLTQFWLSRDSFRPSSQHGPTCPPRAPPARV